MKTKIDIISGFLGSGKTTLIKKLLKEKLHSENIVIIENEFGEIGIDGSILEKSNVEVKEINSGCICCTLVGEFEKAIQEIVTKYNPDRIIIEPSGVAKLSDIIKACETTKLKNLIKINMIITIVDILKYELYVDNFGEFFENQIENAKTIILSRTEKSDRENLESVVDSIHKLNNKCNIITTSLECLTSDIIIDVAEQNDSASLEKQIRSAKNFSIKSHTYTKETENVNSHPHNHAANEVFQVWGVETPNIYKENELNKILSSLSNDKTYGFILRGKGIVQSDKNKWLQFDYVPGEFEMKNIDPSYTGRLCIIGENLNKNKLCNLFNVTE
ncbi:GTP-binding protein [Clostridium tagluense]|uniref:CobW family GTP-binding protein n=1 Tax=Clostridium tagluense TaxID=360422 RepID=UPI001CF4EDCE|nr:GTP-binding protein [Clostridium tagluense]MCB2312343.1 GTP-binding protein [Clostridium tagluense]MCB2317018.1 GTP-binding protein [Clostridium tagluense]MCB2321955.1 GTP-binding protein [Clostridium tagluense]MCB2326870.1 GTP-binding protein [Clostridium tagluense]MCB2331682.1 GTP-binding protein [Clostridium tagluense]